MPDGGLPPHNVPGIATGVDLANTTFGNKSGKRTLDGNHADIRTFLMDHGLGHFAKSTIEHIRHTLRLGTARIAAYRLHPISEITIRGQYNSQHELHEGRLIIITVLPA